MKNGDPIVIRRVGNGFIVEPWHSHTELIGLHEKQVFNDMGSGAMNRDDSTVPYLLQFIERHFKDKP